MHCTVPFDNVCTSFIVKSKNGDVQRSEERIKPFPRILRLLLVIYDQGVMVKELEISKNVVTDDIT